MPHLESTTVVRLETSKLSSCMRGESPVMGLAHRSHIPQQGNRENPPSSFLGTNSRLK
ncbi:hypothetical protein RSAG8_07176, partial [Rhizoctonia solani AG-8 WAC10335]